MKVLIPILMDLMDSYLIQLKGGKLSESISYLVLGKKMYEPAGFKLKGILLHLNSLAKSFLVSGEHRSD